MRLLCTVCGRNLKSGIQCELCGCWYHYSCGRVKAGATERGNWNCDKCRTGQWRTQDFFRGGGGSTNSVEDRKNGDLGVLAP